MPDRPRDADEAHPGDGGWRRGSGRSAPPRRCGRCRRWRSRPRSSSSASRPGRRWSPSRPTATASRPRTRASAWSSAPASGEPRLQILSPAGTVLATHRRATAGAGQTVRSAEHAAALERAVLDAFTTQPGCRRKVNRPPSDRALAELARIHGIEPAAQATVVSLERYAALAQAC